MLKLSCIVWVRGKDLGSESPGGRQMNSAMSIAVLCVRLFPSLIFFLAFFFRFVCYISA